MTSWFLTLPLAYLLGSIPFGYLLVRVFLKQDIRASGSGNIGATNVARAGAKGLGVATLLLDLSKGLVAVLLAFWIAGHVSPLMSQAQKFDLATMAAVAAVVGHCFPVWLAFRGGKGVATALGVFLALVPRATLCILGVFLVVLLLTRYVSLASIIAAIAFPLFAFYFVREPSALVIFGFLAIPLLICVKHWGNIQRLLAGTESRFGSKKVAV
jgi:glycerol-3-phosphate acyltransferase PlsY